MTDNLKPKTPKFTDLLVNDQPYEYNLEPMISRKVQQVVFESDDSRGMPMEVRRRKVRIHPRVEVDERLYIPLDYVQWEHDIIELDSENNFSDRCSYAQSVRNAKKTNFHFRKLSHNDQNQKRCLDLKNYPVVDDVPSFEILDCENIPNITFNKFNNIDIDKRESNFEKRKPKKNYAGFSEGEIEDCKPLMENSQIEKIHINSSITPLGDFYDVFESEEDQTRHSQSIEDLEDVFDVPETEDTHGESKEQSALIDRRAEFSRSSLEAEIHQEKGDFSDGLYTDKKYQTKFVENNKNLIKTSKPKLIEDLSLRLIMETVFREKWEDNIESTSEKFSILQCDPNLIFMSVEKKKPRNLKFNLSNDRHYNIRVQKRVETLSVLGIQHSPVALDLLDIFYPPDIRRDDLLQWHRRYISILDLPMRSTGLLYPIYSDLKQDCNGDTGPPNISGPIRFDEITVTEFDNSTNKFDSKNGYICLNNNKFLIDEKNELIQDDSLTPYAQDTDRIPINLNTQPSKKSLCIKGRYGDKSVTFNNQNNYYDVSRFDDSTKDVDNAIIGNRLGKNKVTITQNTHENQKAGTDVIIQQHQKYCNILMYNTKDNINPQNEFYSTKDPLTQHNLSLQGNHIPESEIPIGQRENFHYQKFIEKTHPLYVLEFESRFPAPEAFRTPKDLSLSTGGTICLIEYLEERPYVLGKGGMASLLCIYSSNDTLDPDSFDPLSLPVVPPPTDGYFISSLPVYSISNNLYKACLYRQKSLFFVCTITSSFLGKHTKESVNLNYGDFNNYQSDSKEDSRDNSNRNYLKNKESKSKNYLKGQVFTCTISKCVLFAASQTHYLEEVYSPHSKSANAFCKTWLRIGASRMAQGQQVSLKMKDLDEKFPTISEGLKRKWLREFAEKRRDNSYLLNMRGYVSNDDLMPESVVLYEAMLLGELLIKEGIISNEESPWNLSRNLIKGQIEGSRRGESLFQKKGIEIEKMSQKDRDCIEAPLDQFNGTSHSESTDTKAKLRQNTSELNQDPSQPGSIADSEFKKNDSIEFLRKESKKISPENSNDDMIIDLALFEDLEDTDSLKNEHGKTSSSKSSLSNINSRNTNASDDLGSTFLSLNTTSSNNLTAFNHQMQNTRSDRIIEKTLDYTTNKEKPLNTGVNKDSRISKSASGILVSDDASSYSAISVQACHLHDKKIDPYTVRNSESSDIKIPQNDKQILNKASVRLFSHPVGLSFLKGILDKEALKKSLELLEKQMNQQIQPYHLPDNLLRKLRPFLSQKPNGSNHKPDLCSPKFTKPSQINHRYHFTNVSISSKPNQGPSEGFQNTNYSKKQESGIKIIRFIGNKREEEIITDKNVIKIYLKERLKIKKEEKKILIKCSKCGEIGHMKTNKACRFYEGEKLDKKNREKEFRRKRNLLTDTIMKVIYECFKMPLSTAFHKPVNTKKFTNYLDIVKTPIDLGTIKNKARAHTYKTFDSFAQDLVLMHKNCVAYNGDEHPFSKLSKNMIELAGDVYEQNRDVVRIGEDAIFQFYSTL